VPLSTLLVRSKVKKKKRQIIKLKEEIKEIKMLESYIKSENALLKETSAKIER
jgi:hypothetical protein